MNMKSIPLGIVAALFTGRAVGYARPPVQLQRGVIPEKDTIPPVVSNATECGCATFITTIYGAMSSKFFSLLWFPSRAK